MIAESRSSNNSPVDDDADVFVAPAIELRQLDPTTATGRLMDCWRVLQRSSVDAAVLPSSESNVFSFADACLYIASVHDLNFEENLRKEHEERKKKQQQIAGELTAGRPLPEKQVASSSDKLVKNSANALNVAFNCNVSSPSDRHTEDVSNLMYWQAQALSSNSVNTALTAENAESDQHTTPRSTVENAANFETTAPLDSWSLDSNNTSKAKCSDLIGIAYLYTGSEAQTASAACEVSLGVALLPHARGRGLGTETVRKLVELAFEEFRFHRASAGVIGPSPSRPAARTMSNAASGSEKQGKVLFSGTVAETEAALRMFVALGFTLEGTKRRAIPDPDNNGAWRDSHHLAMLDTDWLINHASQLNTNAEGFCKKNRRTRWDEMFARHQKEADALDSAESRLKRSASTETLRPGAKSTNGAQAGFAVAPSSICASSPPSEVASDYGDLVEEGSQDKGRACVGPSTRLSASVPVASQVPRNSVSPSTGAEVRSQDGASNADNGTKARVGPDTSESKRMFNRLGDTETKDEDEFVRLFRRLGSTKTTTTDEFKFFKPWEHTENNSEGSDFFVSNVGSSVADFGGDDFREKVQDYLLKNGAPGPPPSEAPTISDAESDSESGFESCADADACAGEPGVKGKGKAREVNPPGSGFDQEKISLLFTGASAASAYRNALMKELSSSVSSASQSGSEQEQARKKRRVFYDVSGDQAGTGSKDCSAAPVPPPQNSAAPSSAFVFSLSGTDAPSSTPGPVDQEASGSPSRPPAVSTSNADPDVHRGRDSSPDADSEMSDAETISSASTWDVVSSASSPRSPSPTASSASLSSATGSLSLESASEGEGE